MLKLQQYLRKAGVEVAFEAGKGPPSGSVSPASGVDQTIPVAEMAKPKAQLEQAVAEAVDVAIATPARSRTQSSAAAAASPGKSRHQKTTMLTALMANRIMKKSISPRLISVKLVKLGQNQRRDMLSVVREVARRIRKRNK